MDDQNRLKMKRFKRIYVEITNVCNLKCRFCSVTKRQPEFMTEESFRSILDQITPFTDHVYFHVKGEPLLHPKIGLFLDLCHEKGLKVNLTTNGTLIQSASDKLLMKPALRQINFSLHSYDGNEPRERMDEYLERIFSYVFTSVAKTDTIISLRLWNHEEGAEAEKNREVLTHIEKAFNLPDKINLKLNSARGVKLAEKVFLSIDNEFEWPSMEQKDDLSTGFCYALKTQIAILVDGTVVPCCLDGDGVINLGNINKAPFSEIIEGERAKSIHAGFQKRGVVEELCKRCTYRRRFN
jgi:Predicted Fe-S oxidoreductases